MAEKFAALFKSIENIIAWIFMALIGWLALTVNNMDKDLAALRAEYTIHFSTLDDKVREIVPRSENERRYQAIETSVLQNHNSIQSLEQSCYQLLANVKAQPEKP